MQALVPRSLQSTCVPRSAGAGRLVSYSRQRDWFGDVRPAMTMVEVSGLIDARMLVEIEAVAVVE